MLHELIKLAHEAGDRVMAIYQKNSYQIQEKADKSALTEADTASHTFICTNLQKLFPEIPIISEESTTQYAYEIRKNWEYFFLIDPLDGTKEFIQRNGEFTINIALIHKNKPILGIVYAPALDLTYYAEQTKGAFKIHQQTTIPLSTAKLSNQTLRLAVSRSHACAKTQAFVQELKSQGHKIELISMGSALKFGLIAEGSADLYPRLAPTMEWDTAAGQIIVNEAGKKVMLVASTEQLQYNKENLTNPHFIVQ